MLVNNRLLSLGTFKIKLVDYIYLMTKMDVKMSDEEPESVVSASTSRFCS